jgi:hypothetical protein
VNETVSRGVLRRLVLWRISDHVSFASGDDGVRVLLSMTVC